MTYSPNKPSRINTPNMTRYLVTYENKGWKTNPFITITAGVRGAIHEQSINKLTNLKIPSPSLKPS